MARLDAGYRFETDNSFLSFYEEHGLILQKYEIGMPAARLNTVVVPGRDGKLDLTHALEDTTRYDNRKITLTFAIINNYFYEWKTIYNELAELIHGKYMELIMSVDYNYYYSGIATLNAYKSNGNTGTIVIELDAEPFAWTDGYQLVNKSVSGTDLTFTFNNLFASPHQRIKIYNINPISVTGSVSVKINNCHFKTYTSVGTTKVNKVINLDDPITISGTGTLKFVIKGGVI